ncbi:hypothetical protein LINPERPRIM_LOCUS21250 [Linum perenne]
MYVPQDLVIQILLRLSDGKSIARFRCVDNQWRSLLSDPNFIHQIRWFNHDVDKEKRTNVLIKHPLGDQNTALPVRYSLLSYHESSATPLLRQLLPNEASTDEPGLPIKTLQCRDLPVVPGKARPFDYCFIDINGCCDGIFCISDQVTNNIFTNLKIKD